MTDRHLSVSQLRSYRQCPRSWAWRYIAGHKTPPSEGQAFGSHLHAIAEAWLRGATPPPASPAGELVTKAITAGLLPAPPQAHVEHATEVELPGVGLPVTAVIDCLTADGPSPLVIDHKTVKSRRYALDADGLRSDPQALLYAYAVLRVCVEAQMVTGRWVYYCSSVSAAGARRPLGVWGVEVELSRAAVLAGVEAMLPDFRALVDLYRDQPAPLDLPARPSACQAYGGCAYRALCTDLSAAADVVAATAQDAFIRRGFAAKTKKSKGETAVSLLDTLKAASKSAQTSAPAAETAAPAETPQAPAATPTEAPVEANPLKRAKAKKATPAPAPVPATDRTAELAEQTAPAAATPLAADRAQLRDLGAAPAPAPTSTLTVLIGALPVKKLDGQQVHLLIDLVADSARQVAAECQVDHWALVPFAEGKARLALAFDHWLSEHPVTGVVLCEVHGAESCAVREVLLARADFVVRGV